MGIFQKWDRFKNQRIKMAGGGEGDGSEGQL